jgi:hypothetical protein
LTRGSAWRSKRAGEPVAQLVEHETFNLGAVGSNPTGLTMNTSESQNFICRGGCGYQFPG